MPQGRAPCCLILLTDSFHSPHDVCLGTAADYAAKLGRLEIASYQRFRERCSSGTGKLIALAAKSTVTSAVMSATEKPCPIERRNRRRNSSPGACYAPPIRGFARNHEVRR